MQLSLPLPVLFILSKLQQAHFEAYVVGGAVRDLYLDVKKAGSVADFDFTTNATPEQIQTLFNESYYENEFGTVSVTAQHLSQQLIKELALSQEWIDRLELGNNQAMPNVNGVLAHAIDSRTKIIDIAAATKIHESLRGEHATNPVASHTSSRSTTQTSTQPTSTQTPLIHASLPTDSIYQITTFRSDGSYSDFRRPDQVTWGKTLKDDLDRRDFTINALALSVSSTVLDQVFAKLAQVSNFSIPPLTPTQYQVIDHHGGLADLKAGLIQTVGEPRTRFQEDALRMLRAIRLAVQLNFSVADQTFTALQAQAQLLTHVSAERIRDELLKMLASDFPAEAIELLDKAGLLEYILPELIEAKGVEQGGHHTTDVWVHSIDALRFCPSPNPVVRFATLLHDIGKPPTQLYQNNTITFYNHEIVGARIARAIAQRLRLSRHDITRIYTLVRFHMFHYQPNHTDAAIRRFMRHVGLTNLDDILDLREGDRLGSGARQTSWRLEEMKQRMIEQLHQPMDLRDLAIDGNDLMTAFGLKPGPVLGKLLKDLLTEVLDNPELNTQEKLLERSKDLLSQEPNDSPS